MNIKIFKLAQFSLVAVLIASQSYAQSNIQDQYQELFTKSSTWEDYKVIKLDRLNAFWAVMTDSLNEKQLKINAANQKISKLNSQLNETELQLSQIEATLTESKLLNDSISFVGIKLSKTGYNIFVWLIILALCVGIGSFYLMFKRSNIVTRKTRKEFAQLELESQRQKERARDIQVKLKRELQTALNSLSEQRV